MKSKAFVFTITALYFVMIFVSFLGLIIYNYNRPVLKQEISVADKFSVNYVSGDANTTPQPTTGWCVIRLVYDANASASEPSTIGQKMYCEDYAKKRFI